MRRIVAGALAAAALLAAVTVTAAALRAEDDTSRLDHALDALVAAGMPGALARVRDGDRTLELARGEATSRIRFRVGSVTKTFVAVLALNLADRGVISLDDPVATYLPTLLRDGDKVTIRALLNHTAGLFDYTSDPALLRDDLAPRVLVGIADRRERSAGYAYSSTNYLALGLVLEEATKTSLAELLRRHVFLPFGLRETTFEPGIVSGSYLRGHSVAARDGVATGSPRETSGRTPPRRGLRRRSSRPQRISIGSSPGSRRAVSPDGWRPQRASATGSGSGVVSRSAARSSATRGICWAP